MVSRIIRNSSEIDDLIESHQNTTTVKNEPAQLNKMLKLLVDTYEEPEQTDTEQIVDIWFGDLVWVFSFIHEVHNWLKEDEKLIGRKKILQRAIQSQVLNQNHENRNLQVEKKQLKRNSGFSFVKNKRKVEYQAEALNSTIPSPQAKNLLIPLTGKIPPW